MPSVASNVSNAIAQHRDAKVSSSASNADDRADASPFAEMLESAVTPKEPAAAKEAKPAAQTGTASKKSAASDAPKPQSSPEAEPQTEDAAVLQAAVETQAAKKVDAIVEAALAPELTTEPAPVSQPAQAEPVEVDLATFMQAVAAATQPKPQAAQDERETPADEPQADEAKPDVVAEAGDQPADVKAAVVQPDAVAAPVVAALALDPGADAAPQTAETATTPVAQPVSADTAKAAQALPEIGEAKTGQQPQDTKPGAALPASEIASDELKIVSADPLAAVVAKPGKHETSQAAAPKSAVAKAEAAPQADAASTVEAPAAPAPEAKPAAAQAHHAAPKAREAGEAPAKLDASPDPATAQKGAEPGSAFTLPPQASATAVNATANVSPQKDGTNPAAAVPVEGLAVEIAARALEGKHHFEIRLDPPELGRIHVRLDIDRNGEITSRVMTDRQDTLDLLRRDAPQLERALNDAGLRTAGNGLQFSLRDHGHGQHQQTHFADTARVIVKDDTLPAEALSRGYHRPATAAGGIDIRV